jgi:hypothetical protein
VEAMTDWRLATIDCVSKLDTPYGSYYQRLVESLRSLVTPFADPLLGENQDHILEVSDTIDTVCAQAINLQCILRGSKDLYLCEGDNREASVFRRSGPDYTRLTEQHATEQGFTSAGPDEEMRYIIFGALKKYAVDGEEEVLEKALVVEKRRNANDNAVKQPSLYQVKAVPSDDAEL